MPQSSFPLSNPSGHRLSSIGHLDKALSRIQQNIGRKKQRFLLVLTFLELALNLEMWIYQKLFYIYTPKIVVISLSYHGWFFIIILFLEMYYYYGLSLDAYQSDMYEIIDCHFLTQMFNDNVLKINVKRCIHMAIKLRKKYLYKVIAFTFSLSLFFIKPYYLTVILKIL